MAAAQRDLADGRYVFVRHVAEGGTAHVYLGYDRWTETWRAIKTLLPEYARRPALRHRFQREAATMKTLSHDHIVAVYDAGIEGETVFMVMEYAEGGSVIDWVERHGPMPPRMATNVVLELCRGIDAAHRRGVIHRDIKPQNLLVDRHGVCKVTDFGIAQVLEDTRMTMTGTVMGTMGYMAPEQNESAKHADERADVYSIAATFYTLIKGEAATHLFMAEEQDFEGIPRNLVEIIRVGSQYKREQRHKTVREVMTELEGALCMLGPDPLDTPPLIPLDLVNVEDLTPPSRSASVGSSVGSSSMLPALADPVTVPSEQPLEAAVYLAESVYEEPAPQEPHRQLVIGDEPLGGEVTQARPYLPRNGLDRPSSSAEFERQSLSEVRRTPRPLPRVPPRAPARNLELVRIGALVMGTVGALALIIVVILATIAANNVTRQQHALDNQFDKIMVYVNSQIQTDILQTCGRFERELEGCDKLVEISDQLQAANTRVAMSGLLHRMIGIIRDRAYPDCVALSGGLNATDNGRCIDMSRFAQDLETKIRHLEDRENLVEDLKSEFGSRVAGCMGLVSE